MLLYFDCFSGISGDMTLGAMIDLGVPLAWLKERLRRIPLDGFDISVRPVFRHGIRATQIDVEAGDPHASRNYSEIKALIADSPLSAKVKTTSLDAFKKLAVAEAGIHGCAPEDVHFHEVGGVDAMVDIVGVALCLEYLEIRKVIASEIPLGKGFVSCQHGKLPVPAPATLAILSNVPVYGTDVENELVTPTGAALIKSLAEAFMPVPNMMIHKIGYGAGHRDLEARPNLLRIIAGTEVKAQTGSPLGLQSDQVTLVETCIDDMNPEFFGFLMERLFDDGALDVYWIPIYMKKNRPGILVQVLCQDDRRDAVIQRILSETTSLGVRYYPARRSALERAQIEIESSYGQIPVKQVKDLNGQIRWVPEFEVCKKIALDKKIPIRVVYDTIIREAYRHQSAKPGS